LDAAFVKALVEDYENVPLSDADRAMLDYVTQLTEDATRIRQKDHERLRAVGFDDRGILQITLIASWFNYINRVADALGVGRELSIKSGGHLRPPRSPLRGPPETPLARSPPLRGAASLCGRLSPAC